VDHAAAAAIEAEAEELLRASKEWPDPDDLRGGVREAESDKVRPGLTPEEEFIRDSDEEIAMILAEDLSIGGGRSNTHALGTYMASYAEDGYRHRARDGKNSYSTTDGPWNSQVVKVIETSDGYHSVFYSTKIYGRDTLVISSTGTLEGEYVTGLDGKTNIETFDRIPSQHHTALASAAMAVLGKNPDTDIYIVGHSKGGGQANFVGSILHIPSFSYNASGTPYIIREAIRMGGTTDHIVEFSGSRDMLTRYLPIGGSSWGGRWYDVPDSEHGMSEMKYRLQLWRQLAPK